MMLPLLHQGMVLMGVPYSQSELSSTQTGGTPYGASHLGGEEGRGLSTEEISIAQAQGKRLAQHALKMV